MSIYEDENVEIVEETPIQVSLPSWLVVLLTLMVVGTGYLLYATQSHYTEITNELQEVDKQLATLEGRSTQIEDETAALQAELNVTTKRLGVTRAELGRARADVQQAREQERAEGAKL